MSENLKRYGIVCALVVGCAYGYVVLRGPQGLPALEEKWQEIRSLQMQNVELQQKVQAKRERIQRLRNSQAEQELEIRQRLKLLRKGETTFILSEDDEVPVTAPSATPSPSVTPSASPTPTAMQVPSGAVMASAAVPGLDPDPVPTPVAAPKKPQPTVMAVVPTVKATAASPTPTPVPTPDPSLDPGEEPPPPAGSSH